MGYYMRYITTDARPVTLDALERALKEVDQGYAIARTAFDDTTGDLSFREGLCGVVEINIPGDDLFEEDITELRELVAGSHGAAEHRVLDTLNNAKAIIAVEAIWQGSDSEATLASIDLLWLWLFEHFPGLLQADNDGFYDQNGLILELDLKI